MPGYTDHTFRAILVAKHDDRAISAGQEAKEGTGFFGAQGKVEVYEKSVYDFEW
jgi:hypothetical protein